MKAFVFFLILALPALVSSSQPTTSTASTVQPITIVCRILTGASGKKMFDYGHLDQLLPDSLKASTLIHPKNEFHLRTTDEVLLWMLNHGWKLVTTETETGGGVGQVFSVTVYVLTREIWLDQAARELFFRKLESINQR